MRNNLEIRGISGPNIPTRLAYPIDRNSNLCASCQSLELAPQDFEPSYYAHGRQLFTRIPIQSLYESERCPLCQLFVHTLAVAGVRSTDREVTCSARIGGYNHQTNRNFATLRIWTDTQIQQHQQPIAGHSKEGHILPVQSGQRKELGFLGRVIEPKGVDNSLLKRWLGKCLIEHGASCMPEKKSEERFKEHIQSDLILIDVIDRKITYPVPPGTRYLALSYVWGRKSMPMLLRQNFKIWKQLDGLDSIWDKLPTTIKDAVILTQRLGERHLWVDSLCIVQDDPNLKSRLINRMDLIYDHAWLTIVAAGGADAWAGLPGIREWSRNETQSLASVTDKLTLMCPVEHETIRDSIWAGRGWTLQEWYFSKRRLIFHSGILFFHCCRATFREDLALEEDSNAQFQIPEYDMGSGFKNTIERWEPYVSTNPVSELESRKRYFSIVHAYLRRKLTYEDDILSAIAGIHDHFEEQAELTLWFGIPRESFGSDLWWRITSMKAGGYKKPGEWEKRLERRLQYPSWSWVGWKIRGSINETWRNETTIQFNVSESFVHQDKEEKYMTAWLVWYRYLPGLGFRDMSKDRPTDISKRRWSTKDILKSLIYDTERTIAEHPKSTSVDEITQTQKPKPSLSIKQVQDVGAEYKSQAFKAQGAILVRTLTVQVILSHDFTKNLNREFEVPTSNLTASLESLPILSRASTWLSSSPSSTLSRSKTDVVSTALGVAKLDAEEISLSIWREVDIPGTKLEAFAGKRVRLAIISGPLRSCLEQISQPKKVLRVMLLYELPVDKTKRYIHTERVGVGEVSVENFDLLEWEETSVVIQ